MRSGTRRPFRFASRLVAALIVALAVSSISGCPSNKSTPPVTPAVVTPPPAGSPPTTPLPLPTANDGNLTTTTGVTGTGILAGSGTGALAFAIIVPTLSGTAKLTDSSKGTFTYAPNANFSGTDRLQFTVTDSVGTSKPATVTITVNAPTLGALQVAANIGASIDWVCYWCVAQPFVDVVRQAANFGDPVSGLPLLQEGKVDADGWPTADFRWMVLCCVKADGGTDDPGPVSPLGGKYQLSFNGKAVIHPLTFTVTGLQYDAATNTTTATLDTGANYQGGNAMLTFSNSQRRADAAIGSGVTNIRIIRPQFAPNGMKWWDTPDQQFTKPFLDSIKGLSTIRYINWTKVIGSPEVNWSDRTPGNWPVAGYSIQAAASSMAYLTKNASCTQYCDWYPTGESWESAIDLANASHTDMWINVPVMATDDYVKSLATLLKSRLDPGLHVYVEWSNEIWNYGSPYWTETNYNNDQVQALLASNAAAAANYAANCVSWANFECHVAERLKQLSDVFAAVYGAKAINTTIRPVLCTQVVQPVMLMEALRFIAKTYGPPANYFYGTCGAPYWSPKTRLAADATVEQTVAAMDQAIINNVGYIETDTAVSLYYGLHNFAYEGGPALDGIGPSDAVLAATNLAPGMQANVVNGLTDFFKHGGDMYMYYSLVGSGPYWGATPDPLDLHAPKLAGLHATVGKLVTRSTGTTLPGTIVADPPMFALKSGTPVPTYQMRNCSALDAEGNGNCGFGNAIPVGDGYGYLVNVPHAGAFTVTLVLVGNASASSLELAVDGKSAGKFAVSNASTGATATATTLDVTLTAGPHVVELLNASVTGGSAVSGIDFAAQ
ncbi:MAG: cadherin-like domain-containing protein [Rhodanobacter sp.]